MESEQAMHYPPNVHHHLGVPRGTRLPIFVLIPALLVAAVLVGSLARSYLTEHGHTSAINPGLSLATRNEIAALEARYARNHADSSAAVALAAAYLQRAHETGDPSSYTQAERILRGVLEREPRHAAAMAWLGALEVNRHNFSTGLDWGRRALAVQPDLLDAYPVVIDASIELGRYADAAIAADAFVGLRPDLRSYARVAYLRELSGDRPGAIAALRLALDAARPGTEPAAWTRVQLGNLFLAAGDLAGAEREYRTTLAGLPHYAPALAGLGKVAAARGDLDQAEGFLQQAVALVPLPEYVVLLGDVYRVSGDDAAARQQYALARSLLRILEAGGTNVSLERARLEAELLDGSVPADQLVALGRAALEAHPTVYGHDALAWSLFRTGQLDAAQAESDRALATGVQDAQTHFHAAVIAEARGDLATAATQYRFALDLNPSFSIVHAPEAKTALARLTPAGQ
jgi:tetratricopeptide (TPR) repeat protein